MLILSQNKNIIINFENVANINIEKCYNESLKEEEFTYDILVYIVSSGLTRIGKYATEERAKEVLQEIIETYKENGSVKIDNIQVENKVVYEMPEK